MVLMLRQALAAGARAALGAPRAALGWPMATAADAAPASLRAPLASLACASLGSPAAHADGGVALGWPAAPRSFPPLLDATVRRRGYASDAAPAAERERLKFDVLVVGAGPAGLAAAIKIKQVGLVLLCAKMCAMGGRCKMVYSTLPPSPRARTALQGQGRGAVSVRH